MPSVILIKMTTTIKPSFLLRGILPDQVVKLYSSGYCATLKSNPDIPMVGKTAVFAPSYGSQCQDSIYCYTGRYGDKNIVAKSGHADFAIYQKNGNEPVMGGRCMYCLIEYSTQSIGYPIAHSEFKLLTKVDDQSEQRYRIVHQFWTEGRFCTYQCAYAYVRHLLSTRVQCRDGLIADSESLLLLMFSLVTGGKTPLIPAPDHRLLLSNGGSLTREQWCSSNDTYHSAGRIYLTPVPRDFLCSKLNCTVVTDPHAQSSN